MKKQRFSLRKYKFGLASVLLGTMLIFGAAQVQADDNISKATSAEAQEIVVKTDSNEVLKADTNLSSTQDVKNVTTDSTVKVQESQSTEASSSLAETTTQSEKDLTSSNETKVVEQNQSVAASSESELPKSSVEETQDVSTTNTEKSVSTVAESKAETPAETTVAPKTEVSTSTTSTTSTATATPKTETATSPTVVSSSSANKVIESSKETPASISSNEIIKVSQTWHQGYKGEGTVVAIIDSGLDVNHDVLKISDPSKGKYKTEEEIEKAKQAAGIDYGKWYSDKVVFAYNYIDGDDTIKEKDNISHGMHVTGIAAGNPNKPIASGDYIYGVAPEAQVMFMRVFSDRSGTTDSSIYVKAIDDAVALGADSINLSLGSSTGSTVNAGADITEAIKRARAKGVSVVISAGNSNTFGNGYSTPSAENPDYGLVGNPSTVENSISVASVNNTIVTEDALEVVGLENNTALNRGKFTFSAAETDARFEKGKQYEYVYAGLGREDDFSGVDVKGKLALIQRGSLTFNEKVTNALKHGATGVVVYNNVVGANVSMTLNGTAKTIPAIFISKEYGEALKDQHYKLVFNGNVINKPNPEANELSDFSSWGVTTDGQLKPDVTAPGGMIYSSLNDNTYGSLSGTSMAAPHVTGVAALVKQYLVKTYPDKTPAEISELVKALVMSTASPHVNKETGAYTSPRQQGAGIVNTAAAIGTGLYVTGEDAYPSVSLGNVGDSFTFDVIVHNISNADRNLKMIVNTNTDQVKDGYYTLAPRKLTETVWPEVTVKANSSEKVTVKVDASKFSQELLKLMPNGYFLEGFVRFVDPTDDGDVVSLPFMGFRGEFQDLPVAEKPIYNLVREGKSGFYYDVPENKHLPADADVSALQTMENDPLYSNGTTVTKNPIVLGTVKNAEGLSILQLDADGKIHLAFSPNADGNRDFVQYRSVFYRNYTNLSAAVYKDGDTKNPVWESEETLHGRKNYYDGNDKNPKSYILENTEWDGRNSAGQPVEDGLYTYVVRYKPDVPGAEEQTVSFQIQIDTQKPLISSAYIITKDGVENFITRKVKDVGNGGILREQVFYVQADKDGNIVYKGTDELGKTRNYEHRVYITANKDGSYTLPKGVDKAKIFYLVEDFAGNKDVLALNTLVKDENSGRIKVSLVDVNSHEDLDTTYVYRIKDANGKYVDLDKGKDINFLNLGHYVAELFAYDKNNLKLYSPLTQEFNLTAEDSFQMIQFLAKEIIHAPLSVIFDQAIPKNTQVVLKNADGDLYTLPAEKYGRNAYGKTVAVGKYTISVNLPTGYELWDENPSVEVLEGKDNRIKLAVIIKTRLLSSVNKQSDLVASAQYYNASAQKRASYDQAYLAAKEALSSKVSQAEIDKVLALLDSAANSLDGRASDVGAVKQAIEAYNEVTKTGKYANATEKIRRDYDKAFQAITLLVIHENSTQEQIDKALAQFKAAEAKLNGKDTDFSSLKKLIDTETVYQTKNNKFIYASDDVKSLYLSAFEEAKAVLSDPGASQTDVKTAIANLKEAKKKLNGKKPKAPKKKLNSKKTKAAKKKLSKKTRSLKHKKA
ncbi:MAG: S8 family serine peptidase [Streptococcus sp.]|nr:S8 family serine peptidase [Streptococcus sp.]